MSDSPIWQILFVDDEEEICQQVKEILEGEELYGSEKYPQVKIQTDFEQAILDIQENVFDLVILDVRLGPHANTTKHDEAGTLAFHKIKEKRFLPIIFYTGLPVLVEDLQNPFVKIIVKEDSPAPLIKAVKDVFETKLPTINRALIRHLEIVQRDYMWNFVSKWWSEMISSCDPTSLAYFLARRLALSLSGKSIQQFAKDLGESTFPVSENKMHPLQYYVIPPVEKLPLAGDIFRGQIDSVDGYWLLLTPSCDFEQGNAERILLANSKELKIQEEFLKWKDTCNKDDLGKLKSLLKNSRNKSQSDRFYYLPAALTLPHLIVDFQHLVTVDYSRLNSLERVASLDSPFAEAFLSHFSDFYGRLGTPDLDIEMILSCFKDNEK